MNRLFNIAVLFHPTEKQIKDNGDKSKLIVAPKTILAKDLPSAQMAAAMEIPNEYKENLDQIEIAAAPF